MDTVALQVKKREESGSRKARESRRQGRVPAILYGHGMKPLSLEVDRSRLLQALHTKAGENVLIQLEVEGVQLEESTCLIKDIQHNPLTEQIQHVDFTVISMKEKIEVNVPLIVQNTDDAVGVKEGGVLDIVHHEIPIECLPTQIPDGIEFDVKDMKIGDTVHVRDLQFAEGLTCLLDAEDVLIAVHAPRKEEEVVPEEGATQPEVIEKGKKEVDEEGKPVEKKAPEKAEKKPVEKKPVEKKPA